MGVSSYFGTFPGLGAAQNSQPASQPAFFPFIVTDVLIAFISCLSSGEVMVTSLEGRQDINGSPYPFILTTTL